MLNDPGIPGAFYLCFGLLSCWRTCDLPLKQTRQYLHPRTVLIDLRCHCDLPDSRHPVEPLKSQLMVRSGSDVPRLWTSAYTSLHTLPLIFMLSQNASLGQCTCHISGIFSTQVTILKQVSSIKTLASGQSMVMN